MSNFASSPCDKLMAKSGEILVKVERVMIWISYELMPKSWLFQDLATITCKVFLKPQRHLKRTTCTKSTARFNECFLKQLVSCYQDGFALLVPSLLSATCAKLTSWWNNLL